MRLSWEREDVVSSDEEFGKMCSAVAVSVHDNSYTNRAKAASHVASIRSQEQGTLGYLLDELYFSLKKSQNSSVTDDLLTKVIEEKRKRKGAPRTDADQSDAK